MSHSHTVHASHTAPALSEPVTCYKLTNADGWTGLGADQVGMLWDGGVTHTAPGDGPLCSRGWIHVYPHPLVAVLMNGIHANFDLTTARLWVCRCAGKRLHDHEFKSGFQSVTTLRTIPIPDLRIEAAVRCAIMACLFWDVNYDHPWRGWAEGWLRGRRYDTLRRQAVFDAPTGMARDVTKAADWKNRDRQERLVFAAQSIHTSLYPSFGHVIYRRDAVVRPSDLDLIPLLLKAVEGEEAYQSGLRSSPTSPPSPSDQGPLPSQTTLSEQEQL